MSLRPVLNASPIQVHAFAAMAAFVAGILLCGGIGHSRLSLVTLVMIATFAGALVIAGASSFVPGRIMHAVAVGP